MPAPDLLEEVITPDTAGGTVLAWLRRRFPAASWSDCRRWLAGRRVAVDGVVVVHEGRRLLAGDRVTYQSTDGRPAPGVAAVTIRREDAEVVVVEKPPGIETTRRPEELHWPWAKRLQQPTLEELTILALERATVPRATARPGRRAASRNAAVHERLWRVQRLDRATSGLVVFARTPAAATGLIAQFTAHTVEREYLAVVWGRPAIGVIRTSLVKDRGDGLRGSSPDGRGGQPAVTHILAVEPLATPRFADYSRIRCRLETGRTHQIRIHLAEAGHPLCGDDRYQGPVGTTIPDQSSAPRLALHAARLAFTHPSTGERLAYEAPWPADLAAWLDQPLGTTEPTE